MKLPEEHHIWCNGRLSDPVKGCRWCDPEGKPGLWAKYPYDPETMQSVELVKKYFPDVVVKKMRP